MADRKCGTCGAELRIVSELDRTKRDPEAGWSDGGVVRLGTICSNPDCPTVESDLAPAADLS